MKTKLNKQEVEEQIKQALFEDSSPQQIRKIKKLAMSKNIKLGKLKQNFCKRCYSLFSLANSEIRIKDRFKIIKCKNCGYIRKYKLKD